MDLLKKRELKKSFRDLYGNLILVYGGYRLGWKVMKLMNGGKKVITWNFRSRIEANPLINRLMKLK